jgi:iron complex transport system substrate-binding protein
MNAETPATDVRMRVWLGAVLAITAGISQAAAPAPAPRVVTLGGDVTEIAFALGQERRLVCDDQTSLYPPAATQLRQVGYLRTLAAEGVLSCKPDLIIASDDAGPPAAVAQLNTSGIPIVHVSNRHTPDGVLDKIRIVADALGVSDRGLVLQAQYRSALAAARARAAGFKDHPRVVFLMAQGPGGAMAAGRNTAADAMLSLAGARNVAGAFAGYKPLTPESAVALQPDVIVIADYALKMLGGVEALRARPEVSLTPAGRTGRIVPVDALLMLGFGPRTPEALSRLADALHRPALSAASVR